MKLILEHGQQVPCFLPEVFIVVVVQHLKEIVFFDSQIIQLSVRILMKRDMLLNISAIMPRVLDSMACNIRAPCTKMGSTLPCSMSISFTALKPLCMTWRRCPIRSMQPVEANWTERIDCIFISFLPVVSYFFNNCFLRKQKRCLKKIWKNTCQTLFVC